MDIKRGSACGPLDAVLACEFDDRSQLVRRWRGRTAIELERDEEHRPGLTVRRKR